MREYREHEHSMGSEERTVGGCNEVYDDHENCEAMPGPDRDSYQHLDGWIVSTRPRLLVATGRLG